MRILFIGKEERINIVETNDDVLLNVTDGILLALFIVNRWKGRNGREILFLTLAGTLVSVFAIFYLAAFMFQFYSVDPDMLCDNPNSDSIAISYMTIFVLSLYVILRHI